MNKKIFGTILLITLTISTAFADNCPSCGCSNNAKCLDLMTSMYNERATMYNVLNLSHDQSVCKDTIDKNRYEELSSYFHKYEQEKYVLANMCKHNASKEAIKKQQKVVDTIYNDMQKINKKYDKEFLSILNNFQKAKYKMIKKLEKKELKYCEKSKAFYKRDPNLRPFGEQINYTEEDNVLCPKHKKWHPFGFKCKE